MTIALTADLCAAAIVAAARSTGNHPIQALMAKGGRVRQSLAPAARALVAYSGLPPAHVCGVLNLKPASYSSAIRENRASFQTAFTAAVMALPDTEESDGAVVAPPAAAPEAPSVSQRAVREMAAAVAASPAAPALAPEPAPIRIDHTAAIAEAMRRRAGRSAIPISVAGVEADKALLVERGAGGCAWPMGDPRSPDYRSCTAETVAGRQYCAAHLKAAGLKVAPKVMQTAGRVARGYDDREAG